MKKIHLFVITLGILFSINIRSSEISSNTLYGKLNIPITTTCYSLVFKPNCCWKLASDITFFEEIDKDLLLVCWMMLEKKITKLYLPLSLFKNDDGSLKKDGDIVKFKRQNHIYNLTLGDGFEYLDVWCIPFEEMR